MKVEKRSVSSSYTAASAGAAYGKSKPVSAPSQARDSIEVSQSANLFQQAVDSVNNVPDVRTESVEGIQQELRDGSYHRDEGIIADRVLQDHLNFP